MDKRQLLHLAALDGQEAIIKTGVKDLLLASAKRNGTALHAAAIKGSVEVALLLIGAGGQRLLSLTAQNGISPLHSAACYGHVDV